MSKLDQATGIKEGFTTATETEGGWKIRLGAEPVDMHLTGKGSWWDKQMEAIGITAGFGSLLNHNYIEVLNPEGEVVKRVHGFSQELKDGELDMGMGGRLVGLVVDGTHTKFSEDPLQQNDPHATLPNTLQHANPDHTAIAFTGTERQVMELYAATIRGTIELNNQDIEYSLLGINSNTFNDEMREKLQQMAEQLGIEVSNQGVGYIDIGDGSDALETSSAVATWAPMPDLMAYIDELEKAAAEQWKAVHDNKLNLGDLDLETEIPKPPAADPSLRPN